MRKMIICTFIIFIYNLLLLILPVLLFLTWIQWSTPLSFHILPWIYYLFLLISPILSVTMGTMMIKDCFNLMTGCVPIISMFIGYLPLFAFYRLVNSLWTPADCLLLLGIPIVLGLISDVIAASIPVLTEWRWELNSYYHIKVNSAHDRASNR